MDWCLFEAPDGELRDVDVDVDFDHPLCPSLPPLFPSSPVRSSVKTPATTSVTAMTAAGVSPSSSPRLPSPPPFTEVQIGPKSPRVGESLGSAGEQLLAEADDDSKRRIRPGTKAADMASGPPLVPLSQLDSPFQLQEHLKALYHHYTKPDGSRTVVPINREVALSLAEPPEGVERSLWLYELCRFLTMKVNNLIIAFFAEDPPCSAQTCPEMRASEWQYLCAVHDPPKSCCAIDYCCHTLDWATNILTSPKYFPSRLTLGSEAAGGPQASMRHLTNIFRRLYRIFAHAWFQHRGVFWQVEGHDGLYVFFKTVCDVYNLIPEDNYTVPREAEGAAAYENNNKATSAAESPFPEEGRRFSILRKESDGVSRPQYEETESPSISTGATTRRHKHSPSTGSSVTTIAEGVEDEQREKLPEVDEDAECNPDAAEQTWQQQETAAEAKEQETSAESETNLGEPGVENEPEASTEDTTTDAETDTETITSPAEVTEDSMSNEASKPEEGQTEESNDETETATPTVPTVTKAADESDES